jgi:hypothetical protein
MSMVSAGGGRKTDSVSDVKTSSMRMFLAVLPPRVSTAGLRRAALTYRREAIGRAVMIAVALPAGVAVGDMRTAVLIGVLLIASAYPTDRASVGLVVQPVDGPWHHDGPDRRRGEPRTVGFEAGAVRVPGPRHARGGDRGGQ